MNSSSTLSFVGTCAGAVAVSALTVLPLFLVGALAVQLSADLKMPASALGAVSAAFFGAGIVASSIAGKVVARFGAHRTMSYSLALTCIVLLAISFSVHSLPALLCMMALAGASNALSQVSVNQHLARNTSPGRLGTAYGIKQSAIPAAGLLAGLAVPLIGLTFGWRWGFAFFIVPVATLAFITPGRSSAVNAPTSVVRQPASRPSAMRWVSLGACLAAASASCLTVFSAAGAVSTGWSEVHAGFIFAAANSIGIVSRLLWGVRADRRGAGHFESVAFMLALGALGFFALASNTPLLYPIGLAVAFALGWGWPGLLIYAVVQLNPARAASGTASIQVGTSLGCVVGPLLFGFVVQHFSYATAWGGAGIILCAASIVLLAARSTRA